MHLNTNGAICHHRRAAAGRCQTALMARKISSSPRSAAAVAGGFESSLRKNARHTESAEHEEEEEEERAEQGAEMTVKYVKVIIGPLFRGGCCMHGG